MKFTYYGHSAFSIEVSGKKLLFDPFITGNSLAKDIDINSIEADYILVSHAHDDHVGDTEKIAARTGATVIAQFEICQRFQKNGLKNLHAMGIGGKFNFDFGTVKMTTALHSSSFGDGSYGGNPNGFIIQNKEKNFYYSGDTGLTLDMQLISQFAVCQFCILPIGDNYTMGPEDAVRVAHMINCPVVIGVHYDTFEFIGLDREKAKDLFEKNGLDLRLPAIGETIEV